MAPAPQRPDDRGAILREITENLRCGDWDGARVQTTRLARAKCSADAEDLQQHLANLQQALLIARTARADLAASLVRARAAAGFDGR
jgi:hypothetical protein